MLIWMNGDFLDADNASISPMDRGFLLGDGLFETMACRAGRPQFFNAHMERLRRSAAQLRIRFDVSNDHIYQAVFDLHEKSQMLGTLTSVRLTISRGPGPRGLAIPEKQDVQTLITIATRPDHYEPAVLAIVDIRRNEFSPASQFKTLCYLDNIMALDQACLLGANEALMLNTQGYVAECAMSNIFFVQDSKLYTPPLSDGILPGIMRAYVLSVADQLDIVCIEERIEQRMIQTCDECFITNSLMGVRPVRSIHGHTLETGPLTRLIQDNLK